MLDAIIVGQGIAGSVLALTCMQDDCNVVVVDDGYKSCSTRVSAGIINPLTGPRLSPLWTNLGTHRFVMDFYELAQQLTGVLFLKHHKLVRFLKSDLEKQHYHRRMSDPFIRTLVHPTADWGHLCSKGSIQFEIPGVVQIDAPVFLKGCRQLLQEKRVFIQQSVFYKDIRVTPDFVEWKGVQAKCMIFCQGVAGDQNPFFPELEFRNVMGHLLKGTCMGLPKNTIFNHGDWLCPLNNDQFLYGSTTVRNGLNANQHCSDLLQSLQSFLKLEYHVADVILGHRPCLKQNHPVAFFSQLHPNMACINGFRGQGMFYAPIMASWLVRQMLHSPRITFPEALKYQKLDHLKGYRNHPYGVHSKT